MGGTKHQIPSPITIKVPEVSATRDKSKEEMLRKLRSNFKAFQRTTSNINVDTLREKWQFEDALKSLETRWRVVDSLFWDLDSLPGVSTDYESTYNSCEVTYNELKTSINSKMWSLAHREQSTPKIEIPTFGGCYQQWTTFKDLFHDTIHANPSLTHAQRMQFLKSKVKGEAEKLIQHLTISSENYKTAWEILEHRYNNKKLIFSSHIKSLFAVPNTQYLSAASVKNLHDTTKECLNAVKNLGVDTSSWDPLIIEILSQKLDTVTYNDYLQSLDDPRALPNITEFLNFLEGKFMSWESSRRKPEIPKSSQNEQPTQSYKKFHSYKAFSANQNFKNNFNSHDSNTNEHQTICLYCNKPHKLFYCKGFLGLQPDDKRQVIVKYNICKNCLNVHSGECPSKNRCRVCNLNHNTLLHDTYGKWSRQKSNSIPNQLISNASDCKNMSNISSNHASQEDLSEPFNCNVVINNIEDIKKFCPIEDITEKIGVTVEQLNQSNDKQEVKGKENFLKGQLGCTFSLKTMFIMMLFFLTTVYSGEQSTFTQTAMSKPLYFDRISSMQFIRDEWKLVVYYDMKPYWHGSATIEKYLKQISSMCETQTNKALCDIILSQLRHSYDEFEHYNVILLGQNIGKQTRKRRGLINGVGYVANALFGVLDQEFADKYKQDIALIKENQHHLGLLWRNQTSVIEAEYNLLKRTEESINRQHKFINQQLNNLTKVINTVNKDLQEQARTNELTLSTIFATNMLSKLKSLQETLIDTITDIHHGMFSFHLLSPSQLQNQLSIISGQLSRDLALPIDNTQSDLQKIYPLLRIRARVTEEYLIFELRIPLVSRESYDLYHIIPIPQQQGNKIVVIMLTSDYIALNIRKDTYLSLTSQDMQECVQKDEFTRLCRSRKPIFQFKSEDSLCIKEKSGKGCSTKVTDCRNNWMELSKTNSYLCYCCTQCVLRIICESQVTVARVTKAAIITLHPECIIRGDDFTVHSHNQRYTQHMNIHNK